MQIKQFENKNLSHYSYAIVSDCEKKVVLIDPARDPRPYTKYATDLQSEIIGVIETHPHADFISGHLELSQITGAGIYVSKLVGAVYPHTPFDEGDSIEFGKIKLLAINTPGHSADSISVLLEYEGKQKAVFTGDTLFIGDCGRPDLREEAGHKESTGAELAKKMYHSLREKLMILQDDVLVYPAHGAGTLCGKSLSKKSSSTIGEEKKTNWSLQQLSEDEFVKILLEDLPFVPRYFHFDVELNRKGAGNLQQSISKIKTGESITPNSEVSLERSSWIIDTRKEKDFKKGHLPASINPYGTRKI